MNSIKICIILFCTGITGLSKSFGQLCNIPFNIRFENKTTTSIQVSWSDINLLPEGWEIELVKRGDTPKGIPSYPRMTNKTATLHNLVPSTSYDLYIRTICSNGVSNWNVAIPFTTVIEIPSACQINIPLKDNGTEILDLEIPDFPGLSNPILGVNVFLKSVDVIIEHGWPADLKIILQSPQGQQLVLSEHNGTVTRNFGLPGDTTCSQVTTFSMDGCRRLKDYKPPFTGVFKADGDFYKWNPDTLNKGNWKLITYDRAVKDAGILRYLNITFSNELCIIPDDFSVQKADINEITVSWKFKKPCNTVSILVFESGIPVDSFFVPCSEEKFTIKKLKPNTEYGFSIASLCSHVQSSSDGCIIYASTSCEPVTLVENFDKYALCEQSCLAKCRDTGPLWQNKADDSNQDWLVNQGSTETAFTGPDGDVNGTGKYVYIENNPQLCGVKNTAILQSACLNLQSNASGCDMSFNYNMNGADIQSLMLNVSVDGGNSWDTLFYRAGNHGNKWLKHTLSLDAYKDQLGIFRFNGTSGEGPLGDIALDQIEFYKTKVAQGLITYYRDADGDGYGSKTEFIEICSIYPPSGYVAVSGDCDDNNPDIYPEAQEIQCNGIDENCNGNEDDQPESNPIIIRDSIIASSCNGSSDGRIVLNISGGNAPYMVKWNNGMTGEIISDLASGVYFATVTDLGGCILNTPFYTIQSATYLNIVVKTLQPASCSGKSDGIIEISHSESAAPYSYLWSTGDTTQNLYQVAEGKYTVTVTDNNNCFAVFSNIYLGSRSSLIAGVQSKANPICYGNKDGYMEIFAINGSPPYQYSWSDGEQTNRISNLSSGAYICTVSDSNGCQYVLNSELKDPPELIVKVVSTEDVRCYGEENGSIKTDVSGGMPQYTYLWNNYSYTTDDLFNIKAGQYILTVTDASGCQTKTAPIIVNQPNLLNVTLEDIKPSSCISGKDGRIHINTTGGNGEYFFVWYEHDNPRNILDSIPQGNYSVIVYDQLGCKSGIPNIEVPFINSPVDIQLNLLKDNTCYKESSAVIEADVLNGAPAFDYNWSHGKQYFKQIQKDTIHHLSAGIYTLTITDSNGCTGVSNVIKIPEKPEFSYNVTTITDNICESDTSAQISLQIRGGRPPVNIWWNNGLYKGKDLTGLANGAYYGLIQDSLHCWLIIDTLFISAQSEIEISADIRHDTGNSSTGYICLNVQHGVPPYVYTWKSYASSTRCLENLVAGVYEVTVTDALGCREVSSFEIDNLSSATDITDAQKIVVYPNPVSGSLYIHSNTGIQKYILTDLSAKELLNTRVKDKSELVVDVAHFPAGIYMLIVYDGDSAARFKVVKL